MGHDLAPLRLAHLLGKSTGGLFVRHLNLQREAIDRGIFISGKYSYTRHRIRP